MKITLQANQFSFDPTNNKISFSNMVGTFKPECLLAIINTSNEKLIYAAGTQGLGGVFSTTTFTNDTLTLDVDVTSQSPTDILQVLFDDQFFVQSVNVNNAVNINQPVDVSGSDVDSLIRDGNGTKILSSPDPMTGRDGLDVHVQSSSFGGEVGSAMPLPYNNSALSVGVLNGGVLLAPSIDPVSSELQVQSKISDSNGAAIINGQQLSAFSVPVVLASDQPALPVTFASGVEVIAKDPNEDVLGIGVVGERNNQIEVTLNTAPTSTFVTQTFTGTGASSTSLGHTIWQSGTGAPASAKAVSVASTSYRPAHELFACFTAAWVTPVANSTARIGLFDAQNGFFVGFNGTTFGVGVISSGVTTITNQSSFNVDSLVGASGTKFTRNGSPEAVSFGASNLFRIRFAWLGSANIYFEIFSPDGEWVLFHNIRQPNTSFNPSITTPNLPITLEIVKQAGAGSSNVQLASACWSAGTTSSYAPLNQTLTQTSLASLSRSVITGESTGGGPTPSFVNVKVNPSGALTVESTVTSSALPTGASTSALQTTGNTSLSSIDTKLTGVATAANQTTGNTSLSSIDTKLTGVATAANQTTGNTSLSSIDTKLTNLTNNTQTTRVTDGTNTAAVKAASTAPTATDPALVVSLSPNSATGSLATSSLQTTGNTSLASILTNQTNNNQTTRITDGTALAAVKAASTAPLATDPALVVSLSPNSATGSLATSALQTSGNSTLTTISGQLPATLGLKAASASLPVVLSADTSTGNITTQNLNATGAGTAGSVIGITSTGYGGAVIDVRGTYTGTIAFQTSVDGTNWITTQAMPYGVVNNVAPVSATTTGQTGAWLLSCTGAIQVRASASSAITGTATVVVRGVVSPSWVYNAQVGLTNAVTISSGSTVVTQPTAASLNCTAAVSGATLGSTTTTDMSAVSTVATGNSGATGISVLNTQSHAFHFTQVITTGTGSIDVVIQESYDNGSNWVDVYHLDRVTGVGTVRQQVPAIKINGDKVRYAWTVTGSITTATLTTIRLARQVSSNSLKRIYDRTLVPSTLGSSTASFFTEGCEYTDLIVNMAAGGTAPVIQFQGSEDNTSWYNIGATLTATVGAVTALNIADGSLPRYTRATVSTAGAGSTLNYIVIKGKGAS